MKMNGKSKKLIIGLTGFCMALVIFAAEVLTNVTDVQAETMVFAKIKDAYGGTNKSKAFKILEIEPTDESYSYYVNNSGTYKVSKQAELGYFLPTPKTAFYGGGEKISTGFGKSSQGGVHGDPNISYDGGGDAVEKYGAYLMGLRSYGMIKPDGPDTQGLAGVGEYPLYSLSGAVFTTYKTDICKYPYANSFEKGVYSLTNQADGAYNINPAYTITSNGQICKYEEMTVSKNDVPEGSVYLDPADPDSVSGNDPVRINAPQPVSMDESVVGLPVDTDGTQIITPSTQVATDGVTRTGGNVSFARSWDTTDKVQYWGYSDRVLYYSTSGTGQIGFVNSDWFREYVFGSNEQYSGKEIKYSTMKASDVTKADIDGADLIYINGKNEVFVNNSSDLTAEVMTHLYNKVVVDHKALLMDYASYSDTLNNNISRLALLLWQGDQTNLTNLATNSGAYSDETKQFSNLDTFVQMPDVKEKLQASIMTGSNGNFVVGNTYVYNHHMADFDSPKSLVDAYDNFANGDFNSAYKASVASTAFSEVLSYITATNKNSMSGQMPLSVTPAVALQYILVSDGRNLTIVKNNLRVLEIQPTTTFLYNEKRGEEEYADLDKNSQAKANRDTFIDTYLSSYYGDETRKKFISFESMTIDEFNGRNEDLIENYDIIFIGSEMGNLYYTGDVSTKKYAGGIYTKDAETKKLSVFDDTYMTGMVYYNIGDIVTVNNNLRGYLDTDLSSTRYPGRDLTKTKLTKLEEFLQADSLIIVAGDMLGPVYDKNDIQINPTRLVDNVAAADKDHGRVDNSSNMYELLQYGRGYRYNKENGKYENKAAGEATEYTVYKNLISASMLQAGYTDRDKISDYVAAEKLSLVVSKAPQEYTYQRKSGSEVLDPNTVKYLETNADGTRTLTYQFSIASEMADATVIPTYIPHLYIDINGDGKYSKTTEDVKDISIFATATGAEAAKNAEGTYILNKDVEYTLKRDISNEFSGLIKWKLDIQSVQHVNSHDSEEGYTLAKNITNQDKVCKILQLTHNSKSNLNLDSQLKDENSKFGKYLQDIPGYKVEIKTMTVSAFESDFEEKYAKYKANGGTGSAKQYATEYFNQVVIRDEEKDEDGTVKSKAVVGANMLVLGFGDNYSSITKNNALYAVESFMESGKPVLLAHDFIMFYSYAGQAKRLRGLVGMDRYGMTQDIMLSADKSKVENLAVKPATGGLDYLHTGKDYTRAENEDEIKIIESTGKTVAYQPGLARGTILGKTQGINGPTSVRYLIDRSYRKWINSEKVNNKHNEAGAQGYEVNKLNEGQLTIYPYVLPDKFNVTTTHSQYFQLDMDADDDNDKESDVVVWYTLGESTNRSSAYNPFADNICGPMAADGYYIYNKGNITYTGAGHSDLKNASESEAQLFVNTLLAAFTVSYTEPSIGMFESANANAPAVNSVAIPYDKNVVTDSSVIKKDTATYKYQFVDPNTDSTVNAEESGTPIYYRLKDTNFVRGSKFMTVQYYLRADGYESGAEYTLNDGTKARVEIKQIDNAEVPVVNISNKIVTYNVENEKFSSSIARDVDGSVTKLQSSATYGFYLPLSYLNRTGSFSIIMEAKTTIVTASSTTGDTTQTEVPELGYQELTVTKTDLLDLD